MWHKAKVKLHNAWAIKFNLPLSEEQKERKVSFGIYDCEVYDCPFIEGDTNTGIAPVYVVRLSDGRSFTTGVEAVQRC